nr:immunoglobulin heavy chain junction region [Macaca mulatta]MOW77485.1 immunoglobulin heavy chain junction region [Macaca mulatta]MOW81974.1 immunoglobulin heavy chain junction region [Macaca mulatta]MOW82022.1 immunoglobulin heavy chain junction region [Macaca mulatta]MOW85570.1 immunoglobulin heavy chain junction region [Macaca mulatta]
CAGRFIGYLTGYFDHW